MRLNILAPRRGICPTDEVFYACDANGFVGCCPRDPCDLSGCPRGPLEDNGSLIDPGDGEKPPPKESTSTTMTDSGVTHTIPNNEVITVTRHTLVVTGSPSSPPPTSATTSAVDSSTPSPTSSNSSASGAPSPTPTASEQPSLASPGVSLSTGAIIGVAIGGAVLFFMLLFAILIVRRHSKASRQQRLESQRRDSSARDDLVEDKYFPQPVSAHTTGTQGYTDPFAPFGGRADEPDDPYRPPDNTFEMDGTSAAPVELPAISVEPPTANTGPVSTKEGDNGQPKKADGGRAVDPRANLNALGEQSGRPAYINHWNQYREVGGG